MGTVQPSCMRGNGSGCLLYALITKTAQIVQTRLTEAFCVCTLARIKSFRIHNEADQEKRS
jgi:hypothetical protein